MITADNHPNFQAHEKPAYSLYEGATVSLPVDDTPGVYWERQWRIERYYGPNHPGVESGYVWLDLYSPFSGEHKCFPLPIMTFLFVH